MGAPALQHLSDTGNTLFELTVVHVGSDDLSDSLRRERAGVRHDRYGVTISARTWKQAKIWNYNINAASHAYIVSLRDFYEDGAFYLYPDSSNLSVKYTVFWDENGFNPVYVAPDTYALQCTFKETTVGAPTPAFLTVGGNQAVGGDLAIGGKLTVAGITNLTTLNTSGLISAATLDVVGRIESTSWIRGTNLLGTNMFVNQAGTATGAVIQFSGSGLLPTQPNLKWTSGASGGSFRFNKSVETDSYFGSTGDYFGRNLFLNRTPATSAYIQFSGTSSTDLVAPRLYWSAGSGAFVFNKPIKSSDNIYLNGNIYMNHSEVADNDGWIMFNSGSTKYFGWENSANRFKFTHNVYAPTISAQTYISVAQAGNVRGIIANDSWIVSRPSPTIMSPFGVLWESSANTSVCAIGTLYGTGGDRDGVLYGYLGHGDEPWANTYMRWNTTGTTNAGRLTIDASSFYVTPAIECTSWVRGSSILGNNFFVNQGGSSVGYIQFEGAGVTGSSPSIAWSGSNEAFNFNRKIIAPALSASTYSGITLTKSFTLLSPTGAENIPLWCTNRAITITKIRTALRGTGTPTVTWWLGQDPSRDAAPADPIKFSTTSTGTTTGDTYTAMEAPTVPANSWVLFYTEATGGTLVNDFHMTLEYRED